MKIQSVSDIITNSSSEVFLIETKLANAIKDLEDVYKTVLTDEYLIDNPCLIPDMLKVAGVTLPDDLAYYSYENDDRAIEALKTTYNEDFKSFFGDGLYTLISFEDSYELNDIVDMVAEASIWSEFL